LLLAASKKLKVLAEIFRDELGVVDLRSNLRKFGILLRTVVEAMGDMSLLKIEGLVSASLTMKEGVISLVSIEVSFADVG
jgi:hypothetical protein